MEVGHRELVVARVVSGVQRMRLAGGLVLYGHPCREARYEAEEVYAEVLEGALWEGSLTEDELLAFLRAQGCWSDADDGALAALEKDVEEMKVGLVGLVFRTAERKRTKEMLAVAKARREALLSRRHAYDHLGARGVAEAARTRFLVASGLSLPGGSPLVPEGARWGEAPLPPLFDEALDCFVRTRLGDACLRELARTEPWRSVWAARSACPSVFGVPAADLGEEQLRLQVWSQTYDNVLQHPECPPDGVVEDDDALDGWLIKLRRERDKQAGARRAESLGGARDHEEVYVMADSPEDARKIYEMNDENARRVIRGRARQVSERGEVEQADLADVRMDCRTQMARLGGAKK